MDDAAESRISPRDRIEIRFRIDARIAAVARQLGEQQRTGYFIGTRIRLRRVESAQPGMKKKEIVLPVFPFFDGGRPVDTDFFAAAKMHHGDVNVVFQPDVASKAKP